MQQTKLGSTQHLVTPLGLGLAALGRPGYINLGHSQDLSGSSDVDSMRIRAHEVLDFAYDNGVRYFDAARSYGLAEQFLGGWLTDRKISPDTLTIGSKWGYTYKADWQVELPTGEPHEVKEHSLSVLERQILESRETIAQYLDLYQIHSATLESGVLKNENVLARLADLRDSGLSIGFSVSGPGQSGTIRQGLEIERDGKPLFQTVQATWNLLEQSATDALVEAHGEGRGVIVKEALANGRLTCRNSADQTIRHLSEFAKSHDSTIDAIAISVAIQQPWSAVVLSGAATVDHLRSNLAAVAIENFNSESLLSMAETSEMYWQRRAELRWN